MSDILVTHEVPFICLFDQLDNALSSLQIQSMKAVEHEDTDLNNDYSVDPLADPRLDKMDLYNMVDTEDRDKIMNAQASFNAGDGDFFSESPVASSQSSSSSEASSASGSGE